MKNTTTVEVSQRDDLDFCSMGRREKQCVRWELQNNRNLKTKDADTKNNPLNNIIIRNIMAEVSGKGRSKENQ